MTPTFITLINPPPAAYTFLSWLRRGIATEIIRADGGPLTGEPRAKIAIEIEFSNNPAPAKTALEIYGPGEIIGFDQRVVIRTAPARDVFNAEPNFFPMIEFDQPDLPWRYTPACPPETATRRLRPWLCLIALKDDEFTRPNTPPDPNQPFPWVTVRGGTPLPNLSQSWAWAHVQLSGVKRSSQQIRSDELAKVLAEEPHRLTSRLLCPRRLAPRTAYTAMLVPAFERGRRRGLGQEPDATIDGLQLAWGDVNLDIQLPVYYEWRFQTGEQGDFEFLVRQLRPNPLPATVGIREMDVSDPGLGLPSASTKPLGLEGALTIAGKTPAAWNKEQRHTFIEKLRLKVNEPTELVRTGATQNVSSPLPKTVAPPLYGRWHAAQETLEAVPHPDEQPVGWFQDLNSDPRLRVIAGLGTQVVQAQQRQLLEGAWQQAGEIRKANEILRLAQLGCTMAKRINQRHIIPADQESILLLTAPVHSRVVGGQSTTVARSKQNGQSAPDDSTMRARQSLLPGPKTVRALALSSAISKGAFDGALRRLRRPLGALGRRQGRPKMLRMPKCTPDILLRMDQGVFRPAPVRTAPPQMMTPARVGKSLVPDWCTRIRLQQMSRNPTEVEKDLLRRAAIRDDFTLTVAQLQQAPRGPNFIASVAPLGTPPRAPTRPPGGGGVFQVDSQSALAMRNAAAAMLARTNTPPEQAPDLFLLNIEATKNRMLTALDPNVTFAAHIGEGVKPSPRINRTNDPCEQIGAAPEFEQPMYKALAELSQDWLLPGLDKVPPDTVAVFVTNQRFIEAYMVGLNHEMARELLFHEYPLRDQRGTYFRQFWSVAEQPVATDAFKDIKQIHAWRKSNQLGKNSSRSPEPSTGQLVLLIRGELLRRYPNTDIYAAKAGPKDPQGKHTLPKQTEERRPLFSGTLKPDVSFFGFNLTRDEALRGDGWFFVLEEHPTEPRFGLDERENHLSILIKWRDLAWSDLDGENGAPLDGYINLAREKRPNLARMAHQNPQEFEKAVWHAEPPLPEITRGSTAAELAYITWQPPVRVAIHASDLLPRPPLGPIPVGGIL